MSDLSGLSFEIRLAYGQGEPRSVLMMKPGPSAQWHLQKLDSPQPFGDKWAMDLTTALERKEAEHPVLLFVPDDACSEHGKAWFDAAGRGGFLSPEADLLLVLPPYANRVTPDVLDGIESKGATVAYAVGTDTRTVMRDVSAGTITFDYRPGSLVPAKAATYAFASEIPARNIHIDLAGMPNEFRDAVKRLELDIVNGMISDEHWFSPFIPAEKMGHGGVISATRDGAFGKGGDFKAYLERMSIGHDSWDDVLAQLGFATSVDDVSDGMALAKDDFVVARSNLFSEILDRTMSALRMAAGKARDYERLWLAGTNGTPVTLASQEVCSCSVDDMMGLAASLGVKPLVDAYAEGVPIDDLAGEIGKRRGQ